jgi:predicted SAM-dependent methyltransferase
MLERCATQTMEARLDQTLGSYFSRALARHRSLLSQFHFELKTGFGHMASVAMRRSAFKGKSHLKVNIGCGASPLPDWINVDVYPAPNILFWDCRRSLPFEDESVDIIFAEHVFEHFAHPLETDPFLAECLRCLHSGGILRIVVPDAGRYLSLYPQGLEAFVPVRPLSTDHEGFRDHWLGSLYETPMELINAVFRQGHQHKFAYDAETLCLHLRKAGFGAAIQQTFGVTKWTEEPPDTPERATESLYVEGVK